MGTICSFCSLFDQNVTIILYNESLEVTALDFEMNFKIVTQLYSLEQSDD